MTLDSPLLDRIRTKCTEAGLVAAAGIYLAQGGGKYSATLVLGRDGAILACVKKMHITCVPQFYEQHYFTPGDEGFPVAETTAGRLGVVICYDRHYPESMRACALRGAQLILVPTANTRAENLEMFEWEMRVAAFQNNVFVAMCNRAGREGDMFFAGESLVVDPDGQVLARAGGQAQLLLADLDFDHIMRSRQARPYLTLRQPQLASYLWPA
jgi:N-carbamoylputrescine amidase